MAETLKEILANESKFNEVVKAAFDSVDTDKSGEIDHSEIEAVMKQVSKDLGTQPPSSDDVNEVIKHLDTNKDGLISFEEFKVLIKDVLNAMIKQLEQ